MKVLMVAPILPHGGAVNAGPLVMHAQLQGLVKRHKVTLATFAGPDPADKQGIEELRDHGIEIHALWRSPLTGFPLWKRRMQIAGFGLRGRYEWLRGRYPRRTLMFWEPEMQALLDRLTAAGSFDLIQVEDNSMGAYRYPPAIPRVLTEHEVRADPGDSFGARWEYWRWRGYQPRIWRRFDRMQVFTQEDAAAAAALAPDMAARTLVNPFGMELPALAEFAAEDPDSLLFVGGFMHPPNVDAALWLGREIFPLLRAHRPDVRLTIVGSYPPAEVKALASTGIVVTERVPAIEPFLARSAIVVAPLRQGGGMRMKVLQAMALGKAVVSTRLGAAGLSVPGQPQPLVLADTAEDMAEAMAGLLASPERRRERGCLAQAFVAEHRTWEAYHRRLEALYGQLAGERSGGSDGR